MDLIRHTQTSSRRPRARGAASWRSPACGLILALAAAGCDPEEQEQEDHEAPEGLAEVIAETEVIDLTHPIAVGIPFYPGGIPYSSTTVAQIAENGYYMNEFAMGEHTGTHVDAPNHFAAGGAAVSALAPGSLVGPAAVIDISAQADNDPDYALSVADIEAWEQEHGDLSPGTIVLVDSGWAMRWPNEAQYLNTDADGVLHFPGVSLEASQLLEARGVLGLGIDTLSTDPGISATFSEHQHFLGSGGFHIENVNNLGLLPPAGAIVIVAPLPLEGGSGAPGRILALVPKA